MGVPAFFRWLSRKYPSVVVDAVEEKPKTIDGETIPVRTTEPNPNGIEFHNLYLDMNGIIHPCTHPEDRPAPQSEDEMFALIFEYIDRIFAVVRPRRLLYMAVDGVAPRAKMNQQRSRRFRAAKDAEDKEAEIEAVRARLEAEGVPLPPKKSPKEHFDSNCITPGTPFMARLADALKYYIHMRCGSDPAWQSIEVILSDANVPGEGEHKIMDFIRRQRASKSHDPNTVHCLCGADADLIMLGLATHEPNFQIVREEFIPNQQRPCDLCGQYGHELRDCQGLARDEASEAESAPFQKEKNFIFVRLPVLREYLERELDMPNPPIPFNLERAIDDWVFMCFFVGNDFLPHLPSLEIRENAIDRLIKLYKEMFYKLRGYLTDAGEVYMERVQVILNGLGKVEDEIFKSRQERELAYRRKERIRRNQQRNTPSYVPSGKSLIAPLMGAPTYMSGSDTRKLARDDRIKAMESTSSSAAAAAQQKRRKEEEEEEKEPFDDVRLWEAGWKERYYKSKFEVEGDTTEFRRKVSWAYVEGLCWVLKYYYQGCASWDWYFPYHYAPFASDFDTIYQFVPDFSAPTKPFDPLQQLMGVFPAASRAHVPLRYQELMTDPESPIIDFYPSDFQVDLNGKKYAWQGVALLPFVDEKRLLETLATVEHTLDAFEKFRNSNGPERIFVGSKHPACKFLEQLYEGRSTNKEGSITVTLDASLTYGLAGCVDLDDKAVRLDAHYTSPIPLDCCPDIKVNKTIGTLYENPQFEAGYTFSANRLPGAISVPRTLKPSDFYGQKYRPQIGFSRNFPQASLADAGHRMMSHYMGGQSRSFEFAEDGWGASRGEAGWRRGGRSDEQYRNGAGSRGGPGRLEGSWMGGDAMWGGYDPNMRDRGGPRPLNQIYGDFGGMGRDMAGGGFVPGGGFGGYGPGRGDGSWMPPYRGITSRNSEPNLSQRSMQNRHGYGPGYNQSRNW